MAWDPRLSLFGAERTRPAAEASRARSNQDGIAGGGSGCGPAIPPRFCGRVGRKRKIDAIDSSVEMRRGARASGLDAHLIEADTPMGARITHDVIYSNAALQWLGNHDALFPRCLPFPASRQRARSPGARIRTSSATESSGK